jgi:hypothetical protein
MFLCFRECSINIIWCPYFFTDVQAIKKTNIVVPSQPTVPMSIMSRNNFSSPPLADNVPLLPPLNDTIVRSIIAVADLPNLDSGENVNVESGQSSSI